MILPENNFGWECVLWRSRTVFSVVLLVALVVTGCSKPQFISTWRVDPIAIDGNPDDWEGSLHFIEKAGLSIGVANDSSHFYFCAVTNDPDLRRQIILRGLNIWLDSGGGKAEDYGIKYPLGMAAVGPGSIRENMRGMQEPREGGMPSQPSMDQISDRLLMEFAVMGRKGVGSDFPISNDRPIQVREPVYNNQRGIKLDIRSEGGQLIYEGKIPFQEFSGRANVPAKPVGIGIELPDPRGQRGISPQGGLRDGPGGEMGSPGGGPGGGPGGMGGSGGGMRPDLQTRNASLDFWGKIKFAQE